MNDNWQESWDRMEVQGRAWDGDIGEVETRETLDLETDYMMDNMARPKRCPECGGPMKFSNGWAECLVCQFVEEHP